MQSQELSKLKDLVSRGGYDRESVAQVDAWERQMAEAIAAENLSEHLVIHRLVEGFQTQISAIDETLTSSEAYLNAEGAKLLAKKRAIESVLAVFTGKQRAALESTIKATLDEHSQPRQPQG